MIKKIAVSFTFTKSHSVFIKSLGKLEGHEWDKPSQGFVPRSPGSVKRNSQMKAVKSFIRKKLVVSHIQKRKNISEIHCAYCGLRMKVTSNDEIEHFSPKAHARTPKWMFHPNNLLLACHLCNGPTKKGSKDVIAKRNIQYEKCEFKIVHPRLDDPAEHYKYRDKNNLIFFKAKCSTKGKRSVKWFQLDKDVQTLARINEFNEDSYSFNSKKGAIEYDSSFGRKHFS